MDVVIGSITSSALEVLYAGVPVILVCPRGQLGYTAVPKMLRDKLCRMVFDSDELKEALDHYKQENDLDYSVLEGLLVPKTRESIMSIIE